jgi:F1F0 ATPase subunit 2
VTDVLRWTGALVGGALIGLAYFGGLWATVRRLPTAGRPGLLALGSFVARIGLAVAGFAVLLAGDPRRAAVTLVGFLAVRALAVRYARLTASEPPGADVRGG